MVTPPVFSPFDDQCMQRALALAEAAIGLTEPNPRVGCVIVGDGWSAEGHTQEAGQAHAEVMALRAAQAQGRNPAGATAYVTLEPCAHHGRTPPCCDALVAARLGRVVVALGDPNPQVGGEGVRRLRAAGIRVDEGLRADEAREMNLGFLSRMQRGLPFVRLKVAASLDGRTALDDGRSQWITGPAARTDGHAFRRRAGAVLSGIGTVLHDDPRLDVRLVPTPRQPLRIVLDPRWRTPPTARLFDVDGPLLIVGALPPGAAGEALAARGAELLVLAGTDGRVDLAALLPALAQRGVNELHVEAGAALNGAWLAAGLVDELLVYAAPSLLGAGLPLAQLAPPAELGALPAGRRWRWHEATPVGEDLRLRLHRG